MWCQEPAALLLYLFALQVDTMTFFDLHLFSQLPHLSFSMDLILNLWCISYAPMSSLWCPHIHVKVVCDWRYVSPPSRNIPHGIHQSEINKYNIYTARREARELRACTAKWQTPQIDPWPPNWTGRYTWVMHYPCLKYKLCAMIFFYLVTTSCYRTWRHVTCGIDSNAVQEV